MKCEELERLNEDYQVRIYMLATGLATMRYVDSGLDAFTKHIASCPICRGNEDEV